MPPTNLDRDFQTHVTETHYQGWASPPDAASAPWPPGTTNGGRATASTCIEADVRGGGGNEQDWRGASRIQFTVVVVTLAAAAPEGLISASK